MLPQENKGVHEGRDQHRRSSALTGPGREAGTLVSPHSGPRLPREPALSRLPLRVCEGEGTWGQGLECTVAGAIHGDLK